MAGNCCIAMGLVKAWDRRWVQMQRIFVFLWLLSRLRRFIAFFFFDGSVLTFFGVLVQVLSWLVLPIGRVGCAPLRGAGAAAWLAPRLRGLRSSPQAWQPPRRRARAAERRATNPAEGLHQPT